MDAISDFLAPLYKEVVDPKSQRWTLVYEKFDPMKWSDFMVSVAFSCIISAQCEFVFCDC